MPFDSRRPGSGRIAVIGGGISGLSAAHDLAAHADVTLYEAAPRLGGHARTVLAGRNGDQPVDTGFIVFNYATYPHLTRLFSDLGVPVERSNMSFAASIDDGRLEYGLRSLGTVFAQASNLASPRFLAMLRDIGRFNGKAPALATDDGMTLDDLLDRLRVGDWFRRFYLRPLTGAIWSTPEIEMGAFPARTLVRFMQNHALMAAGGQHQWFTVTGGSIQYLSRIEAALLRQGATLRTGCAVRAVERSASGVTIHSQDGRSDSFDQVVMACHPDIALRLLARPTVREARALGAVRYQDNHAVLHRHPAVMPRRRSCWSSWNYAARSSHSQPRIGITYWMNRLQNIPETDPLFVTLNPSRPIADGAIYDTTTFRHPVFDRAALAAQDEIAALQGRDRTWFAGAWLRHGFHEDGIHSARQVTRALIGELAAVQRRVAA